jgi:predicted RNA-binding Zn-ribbon protein involved in translation (DUF1610 family)
MWVGVESTSIMTCPNCRAEMAAQTLDGHMGASIAIDVCLPCQMLWFDTHESVKLSPGGVLQLFGVIGEQAPGPRVPAAARLPCPRCGLTLRATHDRQRNTPFQYLRCPGAHGRLISFVEFLREKDFIRPLTGAQLEELRRTVRTVNCSNCGAPIDLTKHSACPHCGSPLSLLDVKQAGALVAQLREAAQPVKEIDPALPLRLERARRDVDAAFAAFERGPVWMADVSRGGLVGAGLSAVARWLREHT